MNKYALYRFDERKLDSIISNNFKLFGINKKLKTYKLVMIKPNLVTDIKEYIDNGANTDTRIIESVLKYLSKFKVRVVITESETGTKVKGRKLQRALDFAGDRYAEGELKDNLENGKKQLWLVTEGDDIKASVVTQVYKTGICQIVLCAGNGMNEWIHHIKEIEQFGKDNDCTDSEIIGRKGWQKMLPDYKLKAVILRKKL